METLDRHRSIFKKSLADSIGKPDAGADFFLSAVNAERKGYLLDKQDEALIKMFYSVIRKVDEDSQISGQSAGARNFGGGNGICNGTRCRDEPCRHSKL